MNILFQSDETMKKPHNDINYYNNDKHRQKVHLHLQSKF